MSRDNFSQKNKELLAKRVGFKCSNPSCRVNTIGPNSLVEKSTLIGIAAHIYAAAPGGPRYKEEMTSEERSSTKNGVWLCANCSVLIDRDYNKYSAILLFEWKRKAEKIAEEELGTERIRKSNIDNDFIFFELLKNQDVLAEKIIIKHKKNNKVIAIIKGRDTFKAQYLDFFKYVDNEIVKKEGVSEKERIQSVVNKFFEIDYQLLDYFSFVISIVQYLSSNKNNNQFEIMKNIFVSKFSYYEKIIFFYYLIYIKNQEILTMANELKIINSEIIKDLINSEDFGMIK